MAIPIISLPHHLLCGLFKRMDHRSLCTLRRANKTVDQIVESVRHEVSALPQTKPAVLYIRVNAKPKAHAYFHIIKQPFHESELMMMEHNHKECIIPIDDPFKQLSTLHFKIIYLKFKLIVPLGDQENKEKQIRAMDIIHLRVVENEMLPLLKSLRISCECLSLEWCSEEAMELILPHIRFSRINIHGSKLHTKRMETWPIWSCEERNLSIFRDYPQNLRTLLKNLKRGSLNFSLKEEEFYLLSDFLNEVRVNRKARGKLEMLDLQASKILQHGFPCRYEDKLKVPGLVPIWNGVPFRNSRHAYLRDIAITTTIYKVAIDGGMAVIVDDTRSFQVHFVDNHQNPKEHLFFIAAQHIFGGIPLDFSGFYEEFLSEECEETALLRFYESYPRV